MRNIIHTVLCSVLISLFSMASLAAAHSSYGPTHESDRLWRIAIETRPSANITPQQMMIALQKFNPSAFRQNNINGLYSGVMLSVPTLAQIRTISPLQAELMVAEQNKLWRPGQQVIPIMSVNTVAEPSTTVIQGQGVFLGAELQKLSEQVKEFMWHAHQRLSQGEESQTILRKQLLELAQHVNQLSEQVNQQKMTIAGLMRSNTSAHFAVQQQLQNTTLYGAVIIGVLAILLLATWIRMLSRQPAQPETQPELQQQAPYIRTEDDDDLEDEYDFINSTEGIPAKLDLARAYIDMDDMESAQNILREIVKLGDHAYQQEAQHLLAHIELPASQNEHESA